ncbi:MAG: RdgB/HAM1 family non-canonical purine NTP pyrophosphatase [Alphaproteobacteria bacterium]
MATLLDAGKLVLATHNAGKLAELRAALASYPVEVVSAAELNLEPVEETGDSFHANAQLKAQSVVAATGLPALADDSGVEVAALGGAPGLYTARWAGPAQDFAMAMARVNHELGAKGAIAAKDRGAAFIAVLCLAWPDGKVEFFEGRVEGTIVWPPRGGHGFGYDPVFMPNGHQVTFAEMSPEQKRGQGPGACASHRVRALKAFEDACLTAQ